MCGRFVVARASGELAADYNAEHIGDDVPEPSFNHAPTTRIPIVVASRGRDDEEDAAPVTRLEGASWGLIPSWAKDPRVGVRAFNARSETAATKPTFRAAVAKRRAVIPVTGYYEWETLADGSKRPFFFTPGDGGTFPLAGLYEWWKDPAADGDDAWVLSASILTRESTGHLARVHDRMPVFLRRDAVADWIDPDAQNGAELLAHVAAEGDEVAQEITGYEVDRAVGNVRRNGPELIEPVKGGERIGPPPVA